MIFAFDWTQLAQQIVIGLASGGVWATLAVALVLIYRSTATPAANEIATVRKNAAQ
jgi:hypothetical protein